MSSESEEENDFVNQDQIIEELDRAYRELEDKDRDLQLSAELGQQLLEKNETLEAECSSIQHKLDEKQKELIGLRREKTMIGLRLAEQERESINNSSQMKRKIAMLESQLKKNKTHQSKVSQANKILEANETLLNNAQREQSKMRANIMKMKAELTETRISLQEARETIETRDQRMQSLETDLMRRERVADMIKQQLEVSQRRNGQLEQHMQEEQARAQELQQEVSALNGELQALRLSSLRKDRERDRHVEAEASLEGELTPMAPPEDEAESNKEAFAEFLDNEDQESPKVDDPEDEKLKLGRGRPRGGRPRGGTSRRRVESDYGYGSVLSIGSIDLGDPECPLDLATEMGTPNLCNPSNDSLLGPKTDEAEPETEEFPPPSPPASAVTEPPSMTTPATPASTVAAPLVPETPSTPSTPSTPAPAREPAPTPVIELIEVEFNTSKPLGMGITPKSFLVPGDKKASRTGYISSLEGADSQAREKGVKIGDTIHLVDGKQVLDYPLVMMLNVIKTKPVLRLTLRREIDPNAPPDEAKKKPKRMATTSRHMQMGHLQYQGWLERDEGFLFANWKSDYWVLSDMYPGMLLKFSKEKVATAPKRPVPPRPPRQSVFAATKDPRLKWKIAMQMVLAARASSSPSSKSSKSSTAKRRKFGFARLVTLLVTKGRVLKNKLSSPKKNSGASSFIGDVELDLSSQKPDGILDLKVLEKIEISKGNKRRRGKALFGFQLFGKNLNFSFYNESRDECDRWIEVLSSVLKWNATRKELAHPLANKKKTENPSTPSKKTQSKPQTPTSGSWLKGLFARNKSPQPKSPQTPTKTPTTNQKQQEGNGLASVEKMDYMLVFFKLQASAVKVKMSQRLKDFRPEDLKNIDEMKLYKTAIKRKMPFHKWADWLHSIYINAHVKQKWTNKQSRNGLTVQDAVNQKSAPRRRFSALSSSFSEKSSKKKKSDKNRPATPKPPE